MPTKPEETAPLVQLAPTSASVTHGIPFWQATHFEVLNRPSAETEATTGGAARNRQDQSTEKYDRKPVDLSFLPLSTNTSLLTRLRAASPNRMVGGEIDVDRIVEEWGRGRLLAALPRLARKSWGRSVQVFVDRSRRLIPYWEDQTRACMAIRDIYPPDGFSLVVLPEGGFEPSSMRIGHQAVDYQFPASGSAVVALSDLGALDQRGSGIVSLWAERGRHLRNRDVTPLAVVPYRRAACPQELSRHWTILPWETSVDADAPALSEEQSDAVVRQILTLLSFTVRIEPQLIRFVRRLLSAGRREPGIESRVWQHEALGDPHCEAAELSRVTVDSLRAALPGQERALRELIYQRVEATHDKIYEGVWYAEMANLGGDDLISPEKRLAARAWFDTQENLLKSKLRRDEMDPTAAWHRRVSERLLEVAYKNRVGLGPVLHRIWAIVHRDDPDAVLPDGAELNLLPKETERQIELRQVGDRLVGGAVLGGGSPLALLRTCQSRLKIEPIDDFWEDGEAPSWADDWGRDEFGPWVELRVECAKQRLRWIPPGKFLMGSPNDEEGRYPDEGPRHEETVVSGFWMFDTPCTQAFWTAVMGDNPSYFKGPDRPVESVSWDRCRDFLKRLNEKCKGLELRLPSEAGWEYACRAGTATFRYLNDLSKIAWYAGNSGQETHPVGQKAPNDWGLYDTLGNVFEWCDDVWADNYNPRPPAAASALRVFRGGSWRTGALVVRAAYRDLLEPSLRDDHLGFRCAGFTAPGPVALERSAERMVERGGAGAEHPGDRDQASGARWINLNAPAMNAVSFASPTPVRVSSDVEQVVLRTTTRPTWASAIGRDKYGLWAEFTTERKVAKPPAKRWAWRKKSARRGTTRRRPPAPPLGPARSVPDGFA